MINSIIKQIGVMIDNASLRLLVAVGGNNVLGPTSHETFTITRDELILKLQRLAYQHESVKTASLSNICGPGHVSAF